MITQAECWKAILEGETLVNKRKTEEVILKNGQAQGKNGISWDFTCPENWSIKDKFADIKKAHKEGAIIECNAMGWHITSAPKWDTEFEYRIHGRS